MRAQERKRARARAQWRNYHSPIGLIQYKLLSHVGIFILIIVVVMNRVLHIPVSSICAIAE